MQLKHAKEYKCVLLKISSLDSAEEQLNELFNDGWQFHSVFTVVLMHGGTAEYAVVFK